MVGRVAKRAPDQEASAAAEPEAKKVKVEPADGAADADAAAEPAADGADAAVAAEEPPVKKEEADAADEEAAFPPPPTAAAAVEPVTLGYRTFTSGQQAHHYISTILKNWNLGQDLNEVRARLWVAGCWGDVNTHS